MKAQVREQGRHLPTGRAPQDQAVSGSSLSLSQTGENTLFTKVFQTCDNCMKMIESTLGHSILTQRFEDLLDF